MAEGLTPQKLIPEPSPYDLPEHRDRTFACDWLFAGKEAGAIAFFGETLVCQNDHGTELWKHIFSQFREGSEQTLGDVWMRGCRKYWLDNRKNEDVFHNPRIYLGVMTFFGDPSLRIHPPK